MLRVVWESNCRLSSFTSHHSAPFAISLCFAHNFEKISILNSIHNTLKTFYFSFPLCFFKFFSITIALQFAIASALFCTLYDFRFVRISSIICAIFFVLVSCFVHNSSFFLADSHTFKKTLQSLAVAVVHFYCLFLCRSDYYYSYYIFSFIIVKIALFFFCRCHWSFEQSLACMLSALYLRYVWMFFHQIDVAIVWLHRYLKLYYCCVHSILRLLSTFLTFGVVYFYVLPPRCTILIVCIISIVYYSAAFGNEVKIKQWHSLAFSLNRECNTTAKQIFLITFWNLFALYASRKFPSANSSVFRTVAHSSQTFAIALASTVIL